MHTLEGARVLFDVSPGAAAARSMRIPLLPKRSYHVTLVGFAEGDDLVEASWATARCSARLGFLILEAGFQPAVLLSPGGLIFPAS